jgi:DNA processing protein
MVHPFDLRLWALAFTLLDWPERQKARLWAALQLDPAPALAPEQVGALEHLAA